MIGWISRVHYFAYLRQESALTPCKFKQLNTKHKMSEVKTKLGEAVDETKIVAENAGQKTTDVMSSAKETVKAGYEKTSDANNIK